MSTLFHPFHALSWYEQEALNRYISSQVNAPYKVCKVKLAADTFDIHWSVVARYSETLSLKSGVLSMAKLAELRDELKAYYTY
ncbi:hypothetical protein VPHD51_0164 [Vibrio phage D51]